VSIDTVLNMYPVYHEMDISHFVDELDRLNKHKPSNLQKIRQQVGLSQTELAIASKTPLRTIQSYEQKLKDINRAEATTLCNIANILHCQIENLLER
jgi:DNA-binding transcriptional regulator YiaG